jgi:hypothetical protein
MSPSDLVEHWRFRNHRVQLAHYESARYYARLHLLLGVPAIALSAIVGTAVFATMSQSNVASSAASSAGTTAESFMPVFIGSLSILAAVLTGLQTFLKNAEVAEKHRVAGAKFANLKHRLELLASLPPTTVAELRAELVGIEGTWATLREESPTLPSTIWRKIEASFPLEEHKRPYPQLMTDRDQGGLVPEPIQ